MTPVSGEQVLVVAIAVCSMFAGWLGLAPKFRRYPADLVPIVTISVGGSAGSLGMRPSGQFDAASAERLSRETVNAGAGFVALSAAAVGSVFRVVVAPGLFPLAFWAAVLAVILVGVGGFLLWMRPHHVARFCDRVWLAWIDAQCSGMRGRKTDVVIGSIAFNNRNESLQQYLAARLGDPKWVPTTNDYLDIGRWALNLARKRQHRWRCQITD